MRLVIGLNRPGRGSGVTVGEAAARLSQGGLRISPSQIRKLEREGLLPRTSRSDGNYRVLTDDDLDRLRLILGLRVLRYGLPTIRKALRLLDRQMKDGERNEAVQAYLTWLNDTADAQIQQLQQLKTSLRRYRR